VLHLSIERDRHELSSLDQEMQSRVRSHP
jgi:hypothetical protein